MAYVIGSDCISCGSCAADCPVDCITPGDDIYMINPNECIDCGTCAEACPVDCITQA